MKAILSTFFMSLLLFNSHAFAFISVIDVTDESANKTITVMNASDITLEEMNEKRLNYRGRAVEIVPLFTAIAKATGHGLVEVEYEINEITNTVAFIVKTQGFGGFSYSYWVLKQSGN